MPSKIKTSISSGNVNVGFSAALRNAPRSADVIDPPNIGQFDVFLWQAADYVNRVSSSNLGELELLNRTSIITNLTNSNVEDIITARIVYRNSTDLANFVNSLTSGSGLVIYRDKNNIVKYNITGSSDSSSGSNRIKRVDLSYAGHILGSSGLNASSTDIPVYLGRSITNGADDSGTSGGTAGMRKAVGLAIRKKLTNAAWTKVLTNTFPKGKTVIVDSTISLEQNFNPVSHVSRAIRITRDNVRVRGYGTERIGIAGNETTNLEPQRLRAVAEASGSSGNHTYALEAYIEEPDYFLVMDRGHERIAAFLAEGYNNPDNLANDGTGGAILYKDINDVETISGVYDQYRDFNGVLTATTSWDMNTILEVAGHIYIFSYSTFSNDSDRRPPRMNVIDLVSHERVTRLERVLPYAGGGDSIQGACNLLDVAYLLHSPLYPGAWPNEPGVGYIRAHRLPTWEHLPNLDVTLPSVQNRRIYTGLCTDGTNMWISKVDDGVNPSATGSELIGYSINSDYSLSRDSSKDVNIPSISKPGRSATIRGVAGCTCTDTHLMTLFRGGARVAFNLSDLSRDTSADWLRESNDNRYTSIEYIPGDVWASQGSGLILEEAE